MRIQTIEQNIALKQLKAHQDQWLFNCIQSDWERSGSVVECLTRDRREGRGFEPHRRHCVVCLSKNIHPSLVLVNPGRPVPL